MKEISFYLFSKPEPQGSIRAFMPKGRKVPILTSANKNLRPYRHDLAQMASEDMALRGYEAPLAPAGVPVAVTITFHLAKPKSTPRRVQNPTKKPDIDKLARAVLDALTGVAYADDSQVVALHLVKQFGSPESTQVMVQCGDDVYLGLP